MNQGALTLKLCYENNVPIKIKYQDDLTRCFMISVANVRLYQDPNTRESDILLLTRKNFTTGYTYRMADPGKPKTPCMTGHWDSFPHGPNKDVDESGDLTMAYTEDGDALEVAFNSHPVNWSVENKEKEPHKRLRI